MPWYENAEADFERDFGCMIQLDDYKLRHMATHLYAAGQHGRLRRLLLGNKAWLEAKFVRLGNDRGYVTDIDILLGDLADPIHPDGVVDAIAAWVARSCVEARVRAYTDSDLRLLVLLNRQAEACQHFRLRTKPHEKYQGVLAVYSALLERNISDTELLSEALQCARSIEDPFGKSQALRDCTLAYARLGDPIVVDLLEETVSYVVQQIFPEGQLIELEEFTKTLLQNGFIEEAKKLTQRVPHIELQVALCQCIYRYLIHQGASQSATFADIYRDHIVRLSSVEQLAVEWLHYLSLAVKWDKLQTIDAVSDARNAISKLDPTQRVKMGVTLATTIVGLDPDEAAWLLENAEHTAQSINTEPDQSQAWGNVVRGWALIGQTDRALGLVDKVENARILVKAMAEVLRCLVGQGRVIEAIQYADQCQTEWEDPWLLENLAELLATVGDVAGVINVLKILRYEEPLKSALKKAIPLLVKQGHVQAAFAISDAVKGEALRSIAGASLIRALVTKGMLNEARQKLDLITDSEQKSMALAAIGVALVQCGQLDEATDLCSQIDNSYYLKELLVARAEALATRGDVDGALKLANSLECSFLVKEIDKIEVLRKIVTIRIEADDPRGESLFNELLNASRTEMNFKQEQRFDELHADVLHLLQPEKDDIRTPDRMGAPVLQLTEYRSTTEVVTDLVSKGQADEALALAKQKNDTSALGVVARALFEMGDSRAIEVVNAMQASLSDHYATKYEEQLPVVAHTLAHMQLFVRALQVLNIRDPESFIRELVGWSRPMEQLEIGLSAKVLRQAVRIASWVYPRWRLSD